MSRRLLVIDASHMAHRAYHTRELHTTTGIDTSILHGLVDMIQSLCERFRTSNHLLVWDTNKPTFRHRLFPEYKCRASSPPPEKIEERRRVAEGKAEAIKGLKMLGVPMVGVDGWEADDLVGMIAHGLPCMGEDADHVVCVTDDKDYYQLATGTKVVVWRPIKGELITEAWLKDQYNLTPRQWVDFKAMVGESDTQDNIPGIDGIGEKRALELLWTHGGIEAIGDWLEEEAKKAKPKKTVLKWSGQFVAGKADLAYQLSRIETDSTKLDVHDRGKLMQRIVDAFQTRNVSVHDIVKFKAHYEFGSLHTERWTKACGYNVT